MMSKALRFSLLIVGLTLFSGLGFAQTNDDLSDSENTNIYFGASASLHYIIPSLDIHVTVEDVFNDDIDLRATVGGLWAGGGGFAALGVNGIYTLSEDSSNVKNYLGFGPRVIFFSDSFFDTIAPAIGGLWGAEFNAQNATRPFVEVNATIPLFIVEDSAGSFPILTLTTGVNFSF